MGSQRLRNRYPSGTTVERRSSSGQLRLELSPPVPRFGHRCPDCGGPLAFGEGCSLCPICGHSACA